MNRTISSASAVTLALVLWSEAARADYTPLVHQGVFDTARSSSDDSYPFTQSGRYDRRSTRSSQGSVTVPRQSRQRSASRPATGSATRTASRTGSRRAAYYSRPQPVQRHVRSAPAARSGDGQSGMASYYWQPQRLASGGVFDPNALTAAHRSLPFGTRVRVTHASTGRSVMVKINDRGPFVGGRIIDLSSAAAGAIGMRGAGVARVNLQVLGR